MRQPGHYGDSGGNAYVAAQMQNMSGQRMEHKSGQYQGRPESLASEKDHSYGTSKADGHLRWQRDGSKAPNAMSSPLYNDGQVGDASRSYYQGQRLDPRMGLERQGLKDPRSQPREEDMEVGYEDNLSSQTFEGLEQKFLDDIMKLSKEQTDAEDAENARHRQRINAINAQYEEQLAALRAQHANHRDEFLRRESHGRQQHYQQAMDHFTSTGMGPSDPHGYGVVVAPGGEQLRTYGGDNYDSYREQTRFLGNTRERGFESRGQYPGGRVYDTASRYY